MLLSTNNQEITAWLLAATSCNSETLQNVWQYAKEILTTVELNKMLLVTDNQGMSAWHWAASKGRSGTLKKYDSVLNRY